MKTQYIVKGKNIQVLPVMETFLSLQGEGKHTGVEAWFVRLAGCNVGCHWCDVKSSWEKSEHLDMTIDQIVDPILSSDVKWVIITGGEPLLYDLESLTGRLKRAGKQIMLETSGSAPLSGHWDWITCSPKKFKAPLDSVLAETDELKVVVYHHSDIDFAQSFVAKVNPQCRLSLQPEWSKRTQMTPKIDQWIDQNPNWHKSIQTHKYLGIR